MQLVYEALRAEAVGDIAVAALDRSLRQRWQSLGLVGLFTDEDCAPVHESVGRVQLLGATESAESCGGPWRFIEARSTKA